MLWAAVAIHVWATGEVVVAVAVVPRLEAQEPRADLGVVLSRIHFREPENSRRKPFHQPNTLTCSNNPHLLTLNELGGAKCPRRNQE